MSMWQIPNRFRWRLLPFWLLWLLKYLRSGRVRRFRLGLLCCNFFATTLLFVFWGFLVVLKKLWNTCFALRLPQTRKLLLTLVPVLVMAFPYNVSKKIPLILFPIFLGSIIHGLESFQKFHCMLKELTEFLFYDMVSEYNVRPRSFTELLRTGFRKDVPLWKLSVFLNDPIETWMRWQEIVASTTTLH